MGRRRGVCRSDPAGGVADWALALRAALAKCDLTYQDVRDRSGLSLDAIAACLGGQPRVSLTTLGRMAAALGLRVEVRFGRADEEL